MRIRITQIVKELISLSIFRSGSDACLMHFALGDIFPLNSEGQLGFIISLIVSLTNTNTNTSIKLVLHII